MNIDGCRGDGSSYKDHNDWLNLDYLFRGTSGNKFDAKNSDQANIDINSNIVVLSLLIGDFYGGTQPPPEVDDIQELRNTPVGFRVTTCNPALNGLLLPEFITENNPTGNVCDVSQRIADDTYYVRNLLIRFTGMQISNNPDPDPTRYDPMLQKGSDSLSGQLGSGKTIP